MIGLTADAGDHFKKSGDNTPRTLYCTVHGDEGHIHYIEQIIYENTHIQQLMFNKTLMKRNKAKTKNYFMRK
jgi:hypothetical protein